MNDQPHGPATAPQPVTPGSPPQAPPPPVPYLPGQPPVPYGPPVGKIRSTGLGILLAVVTFGIYPLVWYFMVHDEMKRHSNDGLGGGLALVLAILVGFVMPYLTSSEIGHLYERRGMRRPVSGLTGLWYFPGMFILIGPLIWYIKTNGALNAYWRSCGVR